MIGWPIVIPLKDALWNGEKLFFSFIQCDSSQHISVISQRKKILEIPVHLWIEALIKAKDNANVIKAAPILKDNHAHFDSVRNWPFNGKNRRKCVVCHKNGLQKWSTVICKKYDVALCV